MNPSGFICPRRIGFLFPHPCGRLSPIGCPDCNNGQVEDPYRDRSDREGYNDYDDYDGDSVYQGSASETLDFNEADGENLVRPDDEFDEEFEDDLTES